MRGFLHWKWHLDEMYVRLPGEMVCLRRAVDHEGEMLELRRQDERQERCAHVHEVGAEASWDIRHPDTCRKRVGQRAVCAAPMLQRPCRR